MVRCPVCGREFDGQPFSRYGNSGSITLNGMSVDNADQSLTLTRAQDPPSQYPKLHANLQVRIAK